jgi:RNA polymerase sigma factor (sigma-70 family)
LFTQYQLRVFRFILRRVRTEAVAEELTNEVFLEIWRNAAKFEGRSTLSSWILGIAHNRAISSLRKRREETIEEARPRPPPMMPTHLRCARKRTIKARYCAAALSVCPKITQRLSTLSTIMSCRSPKLPNCWHTGKYREDADVSRT